MVLWPTDRQTHRLCYCVSSNRPHLSSTVTWPKNSTDRNLIVYWNWRKVEKRRRTKRHWMHRWILTGIFEQINLKYTKHTKQWLQWQLENSCTPKIQKKFKKKHLNHNLSIHLTDLHYARRYSLLRYVHYWKREREKPSSLEILKVGPGSKKIFRDKLEKAFTHIRCQQSLSKRKR